MRTHLDPAGTDLLGTDQPGTAWLVSCRVARVKPKGSIVYVGALTLDVLLGDVRSLKQKRSAVRPLIAEVNRKFPGLAVAETGYQDLHRRAEIGVAVVTSTASHAVEVLEACERFVAARPEIELLSARQRLFNDEGE